MVTILDLKQMIAEPASKEWFEKWEDGECVGCGGRATRTNNTLCDRCWQDTEGGNK